MGIDDEFSDYAEDDKEGGVDKAGDGQKLDLDPELVKLRDR